MFCNNATNRVDKCGTVVNFAVSDDYRADKLSSLIAIDHGESSPTVGDGDALVKPTPVPDLRDADDCSGDSDAAHGELLVTNVEAVQATDGFDIGKVTTGTYIE